MILVLGPYLFGPDIEEGVIYGKEYIPEELTMCGKVSCMEEEKYIFKLRYGDLEGEIQVNESVFNKFDIGDYYGDIEEVDKDD